MLTVPQSCMSVSSATVPLCHFVCPSGIHAYAGRRSVHLQIDVMALYSPGLVTRGKAQLMATIVAAFATSNQALVNSAITNLNFNLVRVDEVSPDLDLLGKRGTCRLVSP